MNIKKLTPKQKEFAERNHGLIFSFLNENRLDENEYYDIVAFGFLTAVKKYLTRKDLIEKYAFSTIAYASMRNSIKNHKLAQARQKRKADVISLETSLSDDSQFALYDIIPGIDALMKDFETELLLHEIASRVNKQQFQIIQLKADGYGVRDIARKQHIKMKTVSDILDSAKEAIYAACQA